MDNEKKNIKEMNKTQVFNVIILDRSGSMGCIQRAAIDGFNETLAGIKKAQETYADTQDHFVTFVTFCSCHTDFVFDKTPAAEQNRSLRQTTSPVAALLSTMPWDLPSHQCAATSKTSKTPSLW